MSDIALQNSATAPRHDLYAPVHKGLRLALTNLLTRLGAANFADAAAARAATDELRSLATLCAAHLKHEDAHIHPAIHARASERVAALASQHAHHKEALDALRAAADAVDAAAPAQRPALGHALYLDLAAFIADDIAHMAEEERIVMPALQAVYTDDELLDIERSLVASIEPGTMMAFMRVMIPAMNPDERAGMLGAIKASAPAEAFQAILDVAARPTLSENDWRDLAGRLGLADVA